MIKQSKIFEKKYKKFHSNIQQSIKKAIKNIVSKPYIGVKKKGDLADIYVYKFKFKTIQFLLAYRIENTKDILLYTIGTHENFYRDLKIVK